MMAVNKQNRAASKVRPIKLMIVVPGLRIVQDSDFQELLEHAKNLCTIKYKACADEKENRRL